MVSQVFNYNIHDVLNIQMETQKRIDLLRGLDLELAPFRVENTSEIDILFKVGNFSPSNDNCYIVDHKYYIKDNYFYCLDSSSDLRWEFEIFNFENGEMIINYNYNSNKFKSLISRFAIESFLLRPIIFYKLIEKGYFMIHAAGISKGDKAYIFPGRGGSFKTSLVMDFVNNADYNYLGDDWVILHNNRVLNFPAHLQLFGYILSKKEGENIDIFNKINFLKHLLTKNPILDNVPVVKSSKLEAIFFLKRSTETGVNVKKINPKYAVNKLIQNNKLETILPSNTICGFSLGPFYKYMLAYSYVFPNSTIAKFWNNMGSKLIDLAQNRPSYEIYIPEKYTQDTFEEIFDIIQVL